ncbi:hypothetical protein V1283_001474 [Bradyrhizobium sp. AZCC 2262]|uniref:hypothetical protein n=1 Tax=Bradyrhizobium sp. AZCC 2262 TaxID=3117022 RepID=UPI002FF1B2FC
MSLVVQTGQLDTPHIVDAVAPETASWATVGHSPFLFSHQLAHHPLFEISELARIAESVVRRGDPNKYGIRFESAGASEEIDIEAMAAEGQLVEIVKRIERGGIWLKMSSLHELDPRYEQLRRSFIAELEDLTKLRLEDEISWSGLSIFVASPNMMTPYHFDHDMNFLFQIQGDKDVYLFDQENRFVLTEQEIEDFYRGRAFAGILRDETRNLGVRYRLVPGKAVHQPPLAPHLIFNGDNVSVSVSIWFALRSLDKRAKIYQANSCLRRLGWRPRSPGSSPVADRLKIAALTVLSNPKPTTQRQLLYSGIERISAPARLAKRMLVRRRA